MFELFLPSALNSALGQSGNLLLAALDRETAAALLPHLVPVKLGRGEVLYAAGQTVSRLYFPATCVITSQAYMETGATVETALVGREGAAGVGAVLGGDHAMNWTTVLAAGNALSLDADTFRDAFHQSPGFRAAVLRYYRLLFCQTSIRAAFNVRARLDERLGAWLLMVADRLGPADIHLTHEVIARSLGTRRAGVGVALQQFREDGLVSLSRGRIVILDRWGLERVAGRAYAELAEMERQFAREMLQASRGPATHPRDESPHEGVLAEAAWNRAVLGALAEDDWLGLRLLSYIWGAQSLRKSEVGSVAELYGPRVNAVLGLLQECDLVEQRGGAFHCTYLGVDALERLERGTGVPLTV